MRDAYNNNDSKEHNGFGSLLSIVAQSRPPQIETLSKTILQRIVGRAKSFFRLPI